MQVSFTRVLSISGIHFVAYEHIHDTKDVWCVARHVKNKKILKSGHWLKMLCWTFRQLLLPSSAKDKNANV